MILNNYFLNNLFLKNIKLNDLKTLVKGNIEVLNHVYTLQVTNNKRELVYNKDNKLISTKSFIINK